MNFLFIIVLIVATLTIQANCKIAQNFMEFQQTWENARTQCQNTTTDASITSMSLMDLLKAAQTGSENVLCYGECILQQFGVLKDNALNTDELKTLSTYQPSFIRSAIENFLRTCQAKINENTSTAKCTTAKALSECTSNILAMFPGISMYSTRLN